MATYEEWRARHGSCRFGTFRAADTEGWLVPACANPAVASSYSESFCVGTCNRYEGHERRSPRACPVRVFRRRVSPVA